MSIFLASGTLNHEYAIYLCWEEIEYRHSDWYFEYALYYILFVYFSIIIFFEIMSFTILIEYFELF